MWSALMFLSIFIVRWHDPVMLTGDRPFLVAALSIILVMAVAVVMLLLARNPAAYLGKGLTEQQLLMAESLQQELERRAEAAWTV
jgi:hypothetical protein